MTRAVHFPCTVEQDEDGVWCAHARLGPGVGAHGEGDSREAAIADLRGALIGLISEFGVPDELTLVLDVDISPYGAGVQVVPAGRTARLVEEDGVLVSASDTPVDDGVVFALIDADRK
jgi:predicted RNase H-like HicB family nuclease